MKSYSKSFLMVILITVQITLQNTLAQDKEFAKKGITEISGSVYYSSYTTVSNGQTGDAISIFGLAPQIGYFVTDGFELGLGTGISLLPGVSIVSPENGNSTTYTQLFLSPSYNIILESKRVYPFFEAQLGYTSVSSGDNSISGFSYGGRAGIKIIAIEHFLISFSSQYLAITLNNDAATERNGFNYFTIGFGISGYF